MGLKMRRRARLCVVVLRRMWRVSGVRLSRGSGLLFLVLGVVSLIYPRFLNSLSYKMGDGGWERKKKG
jgi:hypothetical protein